ncbi:MAG: SDR family NAD(P)-dependent oxidoreductase [Betaproteobacteria bacterium]|jgi:NAD(P)-dependent dehydrogenase (short-subunit alcohol dehydrogenase family)
MAEGTLNGKVVILTGAAGGFGRVLVRAFLDRSAQVAALDINEAGLIALGNGLSADAKRRLLTRKTDISRYEACDEAVAAAIARFGGVHILVNNGALGQGAIRADCLKNLVGIGEITPQMWQRFVATNFSGAWYMTRAVVGPMLGQKWGRIITVTTSLFTMLRGGFHPYGPAKAGLEAMAAGHAQEFEGTGVTVNVVVPGGPADTPMVPEESGFDRKDLVPPGAMVPPILWLCADAANGITGNRYVAMHWDASKPPTEAEREARAPIAWKDLAQNPVWPGGKPPK